MLFVRNESVIATSGMSTHGLEGDGGRNEGWKEGMRYEGWVGRREGDR